MYWPRAGNPQECSRAPSGEAELSSRPHIWRAVKCKQSKPLPPCILGLVLGGQWWGCRGGDPQSLSNLPALTMTSSLGLPCDYRLTGLWENRTGAQKSLTAWSSCHRLRQLCFQKHDSPLDTGDLQSLHVQPNSTSHVFFMALKTENPGEVSGRPVLSHKYPLVPVPSPSLGSCWDKCLGSVG